MAIDKKKLRQKYKESKPPMGCFALKCTQTSDLYIGWAKNLDVTRNSLLFRLSVGALLHEPEVQQLYEKHGKENFCFTVLEELAYDNDDETKDYKGDLAVLTEMYLEKYPEAKEIHV